MNRVETCMIYVGAVRKSWSDWITETVIKYQLYQYRLLVLKRQQHSWEKKRPISLKSNMNRLVLRIAENQLLWTVFTISRFRRIIFWDVQTYILFCFAWFVFKQFMDFACSCPTPVIHIFHSQGFLILKLILTFFVSLYYFCARLQFERNVNFCSAPSVYVIQNFSFFMQWPWLSGL